MPKFAAYGVARGRVPGVYTTWPEVLAQISGFSGARFKGFMSTEAAEAFVRAEGAPPPATRRTREEEDDGNDDSNDDKGVFYAVVNAHNAPGDGVYREWAVAQGCRGAVRKFATRGEAQQFVAAAQAAQGTSDARPPPVSAATALERYGAGLEGAQRTCLERVVAGENVFFTGGAGTGKTFVLQRCVAALRAMGLAVSVTATTRLAAASVGGVSLHAFAGVGLAQSERDFQAATARADAVKRWTATDVLVVDEVSMLGAFLFDRLDRIARLLRGDVRTPFGGLQVVAVGDFYQLPPVVSRASCPASASAAASCTDPALRAEMAAYGARTYCFEATHWDECFACSIVLDTVHRQRDPAFVAALNDIRVGTVSPATQRFFEDCMVPENDDGNDDGDGNDDDEDKPTQDQEEETWTRLYPRNRDIDAHNSARLAALPGPEHVYEQTRFVDAGVARETAAAALDRTLYPRALRVRVGAPVIALANTGDLYNGRQGRVVGFARVAGALLFADVTDVRTRAAPHFAALTAPFTHDPDRLYPVVRWNGEHTAAPVLPHIAELRTVAGSCYLCQLPVKLAWALSIHKAQGMTLPHVRVSLRAAFQPGQVYVALSRAVTKDGLRIQGRVDLRRVVHADPKVEAFYRRITPPPVPPPPPPPSEPPPPLPLPLPLPPLSTTSSPTTSQETEN